MLLLAHLLTKNDAWRSHRIRLLRVIENPAREQEVLRHLSGLIEASRIQATPYAVVADVPWAAIGEWSQSAAIVFMGFDAPIEGDELGFYQRMNQWSSRLPRIVFVNSKGGMSLDS